MILAHPGSGAEVGERQDHGPIAQPGSCLGRGVDRLGKCSEQAVLVLLGGIGLRPPDPSSIDAAERLEPVAAGMRAARSKRRPIERADPPADRELRHPDIDDDLPRQPELMEPGRDLARRRASTIEAELGALL